MSCKSCKGMCLEALILEEVLKDIQEMLGSDLRHARVNKNKLYISEVGGGSLAHPTGKSFRFVRACVRAVLVKSFRNEKVHGAPCIFYLSSREVVSFLCCDFGFFVNSHWFLRDFWRVLVSYQ